MPDSAAIPARWPFISVVVPVYHATSTLAPLCERCVAVLAPRAVRYEILLVDDGSPPASWAAITALTARLPAVRGLRLQRNYGQHNALLCGIRAAQGAVIVTLDDDLQHPPEELPTLLAALTEEVDVVYGTPAQDQHGLWRTLASQVTKLALQTAMGASTARQVSACRAFRTHLRDGFAAYHAPDVNLDVLLTWSTQRFTAVPVAHQARQEGTSTYTFRKLVAHTLNMLTGFSTLPLRLASLAGFAFMLFGVAVLVYVLGRLYFQGVAVQGFAFIACTLAIFSGVQLFALGVIGEYLARMYVRSMARPPYTIRTDTATTSGQAPAP